MKHDNELWYITEHYVEALQQLVRAKGLNHVDPFANSKSALANKYVEFNDILKTQGISIDNLGQKLKDSTLELKRAMTLADTEEILNIFDGEFFTVLDVYEGKLLHLVRSVSEKVYNHVNTLVSEWDLDNSRKAEVLKVIRALKLHPVLADGVESVESNSHPAHLVMNKRTVFHLDEFIGDADVVLSTTLDGLDYAEFLEDINNRIYNLMFPSLDCIFENSELKMYKYILTDSQGGKYSLPSPIPLSVLKSLLSNAWYDNKTGELLAIQIEEDSIVNLKIYNGVIFKDDKVTL